MPVKRGEASGGAKGLSGVFDRLLQLEAAMRLIAAVVVGLGLESWGQRKAPCGLTQERQIERVKGVEGI
jgi:hypothetical protein